MTSSDSTLPTRPNVASSQHPIAQVLMEIKNKDFVKWPGKIKTNPFWKNKNKYCKFHKDHGHNTEDCFQLKEQIADLIKRGYLRKFVSNRPRPGSPERGYADNRSIAGDIQTIHGGFGLGGCSTLSRKRHTRKANGLAERRFTTSPHLCLKLSSPSHSPIRI